MNVDPKDAEHVVMACLREMAKADPVYRELFRPFPEPLMVTLPAKYRVADILMKHVPKRKRGR